MKINGVIQLVPYVLKRKAQLVVILALSCAAAVLGVLPAWLLGAVIDLLTAESAGLGGVLPYYLAAFGTSVVVHNVIDNIYGYLTSAFSDYIIDDVRTDAFGWAMESFKPYKETKKEGDITSRLTSDIDSITRVVAGPLNNLLPLTLKLLISLAILFSWSVRLGAAAILLTLPLYFLSHWISGQSKSIAAKQRQAQGELVNAVSNTLYSIPIIKAHQAERQETERFRPYGKNILSLKKQLYKKYAVYWLITQLFTGFGVIYAVTLSAKSAAAGVMSVGSITVAYTYMSNVLAPVMSLSRYGSDLHEADAALSRVFSLREAKAARADSVLVSKAPEIVFSNLCVRCNEEHFLENVSFTVKPGELAVLSGASGIGKTTLLYAVLGFQPAEGGEIRIGGIESARCLSSIGVSFQRAYLLDRSIRENVALGGGDADDERIMELAGELGLSELIEDRGLDFTVGTQGNALSGGEQRRLALVRAVYGSKPVYLFDEPTAELDDNSRRLVIRLLKRLRGTATVIVTSHDEEVISAADTVISVEQFVRRGE